jgi:hypothetical protein
VTPSTAKSFVCSTETIGSITSIDRSIGSGSITASMGSSSASTARASSANAATAPIAATKRQLNSCLTVPT